jgi:hypothetical protein
MLAVMSKKKTPAGEKKAKPPVLYLRVSEEHEAALQAFISAQRIKPDRTAVGLTALQALLLLIRYLHHNQSGCPVHPKNSHFLLLLSTICSLNGKKKLHVFQRVELVPLLTWLFSENGETTVDWSAKFKEFQARREELKFEREKEELVPIADIREQDASACSKWNTERVRVEQEWPPRLAGKDIPECRTVLRELTSAIGGILETIRG